MDGWVGLIYMYGDIKNRSSGTSGTAGKYSHTTFFFAFTSLAVKNKVLMTDEPGLKL